MLRDGHGACHRARIRATRWWPPQSLTENAANEKVAFFVIARSEATKQSMHQRILKMDCFAALAMTARKSVASLTAFGVRHSRRERLEAWAASDSPVSHSQYWLRSARRDRWFSWRIRRPSRR